MFEDIFGITIVKVESSNSPGVFLVYSLNEKPNERTWTPINQTNFRIQTSTKYKILAWYNYGAIAVISPNDEDLRTILSLAAE